MSELTGQMALVRRLVELGRSARAESKMGTRQPLSRALISAPGWQALPEELREQVRDELNVVELASLADAGELVELSVKPNFRELGRAFGKRTQTVANAIVAAAADDVDAFVERYRQGTMSVEVEGEALALSGDMVTVAETPRSGWAVASDGAETVALDLELTHELRLAGLARAHRAHVQDARKNAGLASHRPDRSVVAGRRLPAPAEALRAHDGQHRRRGARGVGDRAAGVAPRARRGLPDRGRRTRPHPLAASPLTRKPGLSAGSVRRQGVMDGRKVSVPSGQ